MSGIWSAWWLSLRVAIAATILVAVVGVPLAYLLARKRFPGKSVLEAILTLPLVLPPTVVGYLIILAIGARSPLGDFVRRHFDYTILFTIEGAILSAAIVALPLLLLPAKAALASVEPEMEDMARLLGASTPQIFWHVSLPLARRGIASGLLLAFARALGEFGATVMVLGDIRGRQTLPILIYTDYVAGEMNHAAPAVTLLGLIALAVLLAYNRVLSRTDE